MSRADRTGRASFELHVRTADGRELLLERDYDDDRAMVAALHETTGFVDATFVGFDAPTPKTRTPRAPAATPKAKAKRDAKPAKRTGGARKRRRCSQCDSEEHDLRKCPKRDELGLTPKPAKTRLELIADRAKGRC